MKITFSKPFDIRKLNELLEFLIKSKIHPAWTMEGKEDTASIIFIFRAIDSVSKSEAQGGFKLFRKCLIQVTRTCTREFDYTSKQADEFSSELIDYLNFIEYRKVNGWCKVMLVSDILRLYHWISQYYKQAVYYKPLQFKRPMKYIWLRHHDEEYETLIYRLFNYYGTKPIQKYFKQEETRVEFKLLPNDCTATMMKASINERFHATWGEVEPNSQIVILGHGNSLKYPGVIGWKGTASYPGKKLLAAQTVAEEIAVLAGRIDNLTYQIFACLSSLRGVNSRSVAKIFADTLAAKNVTGTVIGHCYSVGIHGDIDRIKRLIVQTALNEMKDLTGVELQGSHKLISTKDEHFQEARGWKLADTVYDIFPLKSPQLSLRTKHDRLVDAWSRGKVSSTQHQDILAKIKRFRDDH
ncbi:MAG: hypothetical protein GY750_02195 [Lentisphaerae bacterium]|nr:hypothetical protein [Lentisphaerota bacterium]MCP4100231.1 hypothetical protein [Lentisphaerota bacterium]